MSEQLFLDKTQIRKTVLKQRRALSASEKTHAELQMLKFLQQQVELSLVLQTLSL